MYVFLSPQWQEVNFCLCESTRFTLRTIKRTFPAVCSVLEEPFTSYLICRGAKFVFPVSNSFSRPSQLLIHVIAMLETRWRTLSRSPRAEATAISSPLNHGKKKKKLNVTHLNPGVVGAFPTLDPKALCGVVNNYRHCHYQPSLNSLRLLRVAGIYHVRPRRVRPPPRRLACR